LKHGTEPNWEVIQAIRAQVPKAPWLSFKEVERVRDLPLHLEIAPTDVVGELYNFVRKEVEEFFSDDMVRPVEDFRGLIAAGPYPATPKICLESQPRATPKVELNLSQRAGSGVPLSEPLDVRCRLLCQLLCAPPDELLKLVDFEKLAVRNGLFRQSLGFHVVFVQILAGHFRAE
jgi:hypothetical protein